MCSHEENPACPSMDTCGNTLKNKTKKKNTELYDVDSLIIFIGRPNSQNKWMNKYILNTRFKSNAEKEVKQGGSACVEENEYK